MQHRENQGRQTVAALMLSALGLVVSASAPAASPAAIDSFVQSHAAVSDWTNQIGRWFQPVCPQVSGLKPEFSRYVSDRVVTMGDLYATIYKALGNDWRKEYMSPIGRPVKIANSLEDRTGEPVQELLG